MRLTCALLSLFSLTLLTGCEAEQKDRNVPIVTKGSSLFQRSGVRCELIGRFGRKDVYLKITKKGSGLIGTFHEYLETNKVSLLGLNLDGLNIGSFPLEEMTVKKQTVLSGTTSVMQDGTRIEARIQINKDMTGLIEQKQSTTVDGKTRSTDFEELATIDNCEKAAPVFYGLEP